MSFSSSSTLIFSSSPSLLFPWWFVSFSLCPLCRLQLSSSLSYIFSSPPLLKILLFSPLFLPSSHSLNIFSPLIFSFSSIPYYIFSHFLFFYTSHPCSVTMIWCFSPLLSSFYSSFSPLRNFSSILPFLYFSSSPLSPWCYILFLHVFTSYSLLFHFLPFLFSSLTFSSLLHFLLSFFCHPAPHLDTLSHLSTDTTFLLAYLTLNLILTSFPSSLESF